jgi:nucleoid-associated protein EbfC
MSKIPNISQMMSMAQNMAKEMEEQMNAIEVEGNAGGGMVTVRMNGHKHIRSLAIAKEVVNPDDTEMLQDLVIAAVNDAIARVDEKLKSQMGHLAGGLPGGFPFGGL